MKLKFWSLIRTFNNFTSPHIPNCINWWNSSFHMTLLPTNKFCFYARPLLASSKAFIWNFQRSLKIHFFLLNILSVFLYLLGNSVFASAERKRSAHLSLWLLFSDLSFKVLLYLTLQLSVSVFIKDACIPDVYLTQVPCWIKKVPEWHTVS